MDNQTKLLGRSINVSMTSVISGVVNQDESDGNVTISSSVTITKPMNYESLTITSNGQLICDGTGIKTKVLDLANAPVDCLKLGSENKVGGADISNGGGEPEPSPYGRGGRVGEVYAIAQDDSGNWVDFNKVFSLKEDDDGKIYLFKKLNDGTFIKAPPIFNTGKP